MSGEVITTNEAPLAIGTYSQAIKSNGMVFISGQIPLDPETMSFPDGGIDQQIIQVFSNLKAIAQAAGGDLSTIVKLTVFLTNLNDFEMVNKINNNNLKVMKNKLIIDSRRILKNKKLTCKYVALGIGN